MRYKLPISFICLFFVAFLAHGQLDTPLEGVRILPSDSILQGKFDFSLKLTPIRGLTTINLSPKIDYTPMADSFKKKSGVHMVSPNTLKTPTWNVKQKFTEDYANVSQFSRDHNLGEIKTESKTVIIKCRDHEYVDGDRIKLMVNNAVIHPNLVLRGEFFTIDVDLDEGYNVINFIALNEGSSRPNTAQLQVYDESGVLLASNKWLITTGFKASLTVYKN